jgi:dipeptidyl aminopeptidase/acylaminoacyl peptidase
MDVKVKELIKKWWFWVIVVSAVMIIAVGIIFFNMYFSQMEEIRGVPPQMFITYTADTASPIKLFENRANELYAFTSLSKDRIYYDAKIPNKDLPGDWRWHALSSKLDGSDTKQLAMPDTLLNPVISPTGNELAFIGQGRNIFFLEPIAKVEYTEQEFWKFNNIENQWEVNGKIMITPENKVFQLKGGLTKITDGNWGAMPMDWSSDARKILFERWKDGRSEIYIKDVLDENMDVYPDILAREARLVDSNPADSRFQPSFGPNGEIIFIQIIRGDQMIGVKNRFGEISFINLDESRQPVLSGAPLHPRFSPDGTKIAFINAFDNHGSIFHRNIYVMDWNFENLRKVTDTVSYKSNLVWLDNEDIIYADNPDFTQKEGISYGSLHKVNINKVS